jgi:hypothetical protein
MALTKLAEPAAGHAEFLCKDIGGRFSDEVIEFAVGQPFVFSTDKVEVQPVIVPVNCRRDTSEH